MVSWSRLTRSRTLDATLQVGSVAETVEVLSEATPLLESDRSTLSNVIESK